MNATTKRKIKEEANLAAELNRRSLSHQANSTDITKDKEKLGIKESTDTDRGKRCEICGNHQQNGWCRGHLPEAVKTKKHEVCPKYKSSRGMI